MRRRGRSRSPTARRDSESAVRVCSKQPSGLAKPAAVESDVSWMVRRRLSLSSCTVAVLGALSLLSCSQQLCRGTLSNWSRRSRKIIASGEKTAESDYPALLPRRAPPCRHTVTRCPDAAVQRDRLLVKLLQDRAQGRRRRPRPGEPRRCAGAVDAGANERERRVAKGGMRACRTFRECRRRCRSRAEGAGSSLGRRAAESRAAGWSAPRRSWLALVVPDRSWKMYGPPCVRDELGGRR